MQKTGRNVQCHYGSNNKYKRCLLSKDIVKKQELEKEERISLYDKFSVLKDPRDNRGKRYWLMDLLIMVIYGILNENDDFENMAYFFKQKERYFKNLLLIEKTPSHD